MMQEEQQHDPTNPRGIFHQVDRPASITGNALPPRDPDEDDEDDENEGAVVSLADCTRNSLFPLEKSLFIEIFSLLSRIGNCLKSHCIAADSCSEIVLRSHGIAHFPAKFPVSREFTWRRVRSALRHQPGSLALCETTTKSRKSARQRRAFLVWRSVSGLRISRVTGRNCQKSPDACRNIPIFGRRRPETEFDPHCLAGSACTDKVSNNTSSVRVIGAKHGTRHRPLGS
jgi:hypothetical protein